MSPASAPPTPRLREGLESRERGGLVHVVSPTTGREHALREEEWQLARDLDGRRTLQQLQRRARRLGVPATPETLESFIRELAARGLLEGSSPPPFALRGWPEEKQRRVREALTALKDARFPQARALLEEELRRSPGCEELQAMLEGVRRAEVDASSEQDEQWALAEAVRAAGEGLLLPTPLAIPPGPGPARDARPARRRWVVAAGAAVALIAVFVCPLPDSVSGECVLAPAHREVVRATVPGRLERVLVADGARVRRGDLLAQLSDPELPAKLESVRTRRRQAELGLQALLAGPTTEQIDKAGAAVERAAAEVKAREMQVAHLTAAMDDGHASGAERDAAQRSLEGARWEQHIAEVALQGLEASAVDEAVARLRAEVEEARIVEAGLARRQESLDLRASRDGELQAADLALRTGSWIQAGEALGELAGDRFFRVDGRLSELDAEDLRPGLPFRVRFQAMGAPTLTGCLEWLGQRFEPVAGRRVAMVRAYGMVEDPSGIVREGMRGRLEIDLGHATLARKAGRWLRHFLADHGP